MDNGIFYFNDDFPYKFSFFNRLNYRDIIFDCVFTDPFISFTPVLFVKVNYFNPFKCPSI